MNTLITIILSNFRIMTHSYNNYFIQFQDYDTSSFWKVSLTNKEHQVLSIELEEYNDWLRRLHKGLVPISSHRGNDSRADQLYLAQDKRYKKYEGIIPRPGERAAYEPLTASFYLLSFEDFAEEHSTEKQPMLPFDELKELITQPHDGYFCDSSGIGFRLLPFTASLEQRIK
jgi:hypothetical protein